MENCILIDWVTVTFRGLEPDDLISYLGLSSLPFETMDKWMFGYPCRKFYDGISILYGAAEDMGICLNLSGQGCRAFESYGKEWNVLFNLIWDNPDAHLTRLDVAFDDHSGILDIDRLRCDTDAGYYVSKSRQWKIEYGSQGTTLYFGSPRSDMLIRIYDKAAERGYSDRHWIRVELQMRDKNAYGFIVALRFDDIGSVFSGVLYNYLRFVDPSSDSNKSRWIPTDYWINLLGSLRRITIWSSPGTDYNMASLENFVVRCAGSAIDVYLRVWGFERLINQIKARNVALAPKYQKLLFEYGGR